MAAHVNRAIMAKKKEEGQLPLRVWNRTRCKATDHAVTHGTVAVDNLTELSRECRVVFLSMPTTDEVVEVVQQLTELEPGSVIVDTTSGEPLSTRELARTCMEERGAYYVDCPVSGGPGGAKAGTVTCMLGGDEASVKAVLPLLSFAGKCTRCGPVGSGMACKAINNILNAAHLLVGAEGLLALKKFGVEPDVALSVINASSGRSLQTEVRLPLEVLTGRFGYGFKLPLMSKDCRIAKSIAEAEFPNATILPQISRLVDEAAERFPDGDYTEVVRLLEERAGTDLRTAGGTSKYG